MKDATTLTSQERTDIEKQLRLDDNNATGSPVEPVTSSLDDAARAAYEREQKAGLQDGWQLEFFPKVLPSSWLPINRLPNYERWLRRDRMCVIISATVELDGKRWLHVSCSYPNALPTWKDLKEIKRLFIGRDRTAIQLLPKESQYVNRHPYVLHMFVCLDDDPVPDFTHGTGQI